MIGKLPTEKESRDRIRVPKTATLRVKQLTYPIPSGPGEVGTLQNLSEEGVCFFLETSYSAQDQLCLSIDLLGWQHHKQGVALLVDESLASAPLTALAEVVWCRQLGEGNRVEIGAKFLDICEDDLKALKTYLANVRHFSESNE